MLNKKRTWPRASISFILNPSILTTIVSLHGLIEDVKGEIDFGGLL
jgi:hypothetical protein